MNLDRFARLNYQRPVLGRRTNDVRFPWLVIVVRHVKKRPTGIFDLVRQRYRRVVWTSAYSIGMLANG